MARKSGNSKDLNGNEILNFRVQLIAGDPGSPAEARVWYDSTAHSLKYYNGTDIVELVAGALDSEAVQDVVGAMFTGNTETGITVTYQDADGTIDLAVTDSPLLEGQNSAYHLARGNHTGTQASTTISDFAEAVSDQVGTMVTGNTETGITVTYQDADNTLDFAVTDSPLLGGQNSAYHLSRANHTGTQTASTISDFASAVNTLIAAVVDSAPSTLDTLNELAAALGDDPNFAATMATSLGALDTRLDAVEATGGPVKMYAADIGNGSSTAITVTHGLGTKDVIVQIYEKSNDTEWDSPDVVHTSTSQVTLTFATAPTTDQFRVVIMGRA